MLKRLLIAALAGALIGAPVRAQLLMTGAGQPTNGSSQLIAQTNYALGSLGSGDTLTRSTSANYIDSSGGISTAAINVPRFDYTFSSTPGLLVEGSRTNIALYNQDFTQSAIWVPGASYTSTTTSTITDTSASGYGATTQTFITLADTYERYFSVYILKDTNQTRFPEFQTNINGGSATNITDVNTQTGAYVIRTSAGTNSVAVSSVGNYWKITQTIVNTSQLGFTYALLPAAGTTIGVISIAATGTATFACPQIEVNVSFASSCVFTTSTSAIRAADTFSNSNWYNGSTGNYLMVESISEATGTMSRASYCASGCTGTSFSPSFITITRICQFNATPAGATAAQTAAGQANGTVCS